MKQIKQYLDDNPDHTTKFVNGAGSCTPAPLDKKERKCMGDAPEVYPKRMSDLEQLMTRVNWVDDKDADDSIFYNEGGRKLNDNKEYIEIEVNNQLITFNWDNVKSFTVETTEAFNPYYVGWVEKANVNNFAPGGSDTLGDDTKGGSKTSGIFSGDGTIRALDGFEMPNNSGLDFFNADDTVTCTRNGNDLEYYINGDFVNKIDASSWNDVYPAIDTNDRFAIRIIDVVYLDPESDPIGM